MADQCIVCLEPLDDASKSPRPVPSFVDDDGGGGGGGGGGLGLGGGTVTAEPVVVEAAAAVVAVSSSTAATSSKSTMATTTATTTTTTTAEDRAAQQHNADDNIAAIQVCGHVLHDSCLREWIEKANSCPICRQAFHLVQVYDKIGGTLLSTYKVEDKTQVAEFDPQAWLDESPEEEEETARPCPICNLCDQEEVLLLCDGCDAPYHTHCIGLDSVPDGSWFCMECADVFGLEEQAVPRPSTIVRGGPGGGSARRRGDFFPRTRASMRRSRNRIRSDEWQGAWGQIAGRIWDVLSLDLDNDEEGDEALEEYRRSQQLRERELREYQRWQQRVNIASRLGARDVFTRNIPTVFANGSQQRHQQQQRQANNPELDALPPPPPPESREERRAWGALERAIECDSTSSPGNRKRKSRSSTASPRAPPAEPERRLKRPRTRRLATQGEASSSKPPASASTSHRSERPGSTSAALPPAQPDGGAAPSFLSSLLKEVQMSTPSDDENARGLPGPPAHPAEASSPGSSPAGSPYASPRALSLTPPPPKSSTRRPTSPTLSLSSHIEPVYPPANYSPTRANGEHSDPEGRPHHHHHHHQQNGAAGKSPELRQPRPRRAHQEMRLPRSQDVSPTRVALPFEMKESISSIVRSALKPHWKSSKLSAEQYEAINRDVSRKLYEGVADPASAAVDGEARRTWEKIATREVARAIEELKA